MDLVDRIRTNRLALADFFDALDERQLDSASLCDAWTVREVLGHLVMPLTGSVGGFVLEVVRSRGSLDRASQTVACDLARRPVPELTGLLRERADHVGRAPGVGPMGQMADGCLHLRDCARPLGLPHDVSLADWRLLLDWLPDGVPGLVPKGRAAGLMLVADDQAWSSGAGEIVTGPSEALALAVAGRRSALADLRGPGASELGRRLDARR